MTVSTGTGLTNQTDVIDAVRSHLDADGWDVGFNDLNVGANTGEIWVGLDAAHTFNGIEMHFGLTASGTDALLLNVVVTDLALAQIVGGTNSPRNSFLRAVGGPNISQTFPSGEIGDTWQGQTLTQALDSNPAKFNLFNQGGNYLRHWILTPPILTSPYLGNQEMYCYVVVEVDTNVFRSFYFGEGIKLGDSGWTGGVFICGTFSDPVESESEFPFGGGQDFVSFSHNGQHSFVYNEQSFSYEENSPRFWNPWAQMHRASVQALPGMRGFDPRKFGSDWLDHSPSAFSGETQRVPGRLYIVDNDTTGGQAYQIRPFMEGPDFFHANVRDITPGAIITDDTDKFLTIPITTKSGANNTGDWGIMIRNPDL